MPRRKCPLMAAILFFSKMAAFFNLFIIMSLFICKHSVFFREFYLNSCQLYLNTLKSSFNLKKSQDLVYVEWASRVNFVKIFGDLYQNKLWVISNILNQFAHLSSASGPSNDVIKMAVIVLLMYTYKTSYLEK